MRLGKTRARGASHAARRCYARRRQAVTAPRLRGTEPWRSQSADRRRFRLFDDPERVEFARRGYVSGRVSGRQETVLALFQNGKFDAEGTRRNLFGFEFLRILFSALGGMENTACPRAKFPPVTLHVQPKQLIFGDGRAFRNADDKFHVGGQLQNAFRTLNCAVSVPFVKTMRRNAFHYSARLVSYELRVLLGKFVCILYISIV